jgi:replicative DNA helicase
MRDDDRITHHERALVGIALLNPSVIDRTEIELSGYSWIDESCGKLWPVLLGMRHRGEPISDIRNVFMRVKTLGVSSAELARLTSDEAGYVKHDDYHLGFMVARMRLMRLERYHHRLGQMISDQSREVDELEEWANNELSKLHHESPTHKGDTKLSSLMGQVADFSATQAARRIETGIPPLDRAIGGFRDGQLIVLAARPSVGKSALASQIAVNVAKLGGRVLFVSLEMSGHELAARTIAYETGLPMGAILDGEIDSSQRTQVQGLAKQYCQFPMYIEDRSGLTMRRLASLVKRYSAKQRLSLICVDYLGLIEGENKQSLRESTEQVSKALKQLAKSEKVPILALSQLNRDSEKGEASIAVPTLSQLRNSGAIEQDADIVLLLHRESRKAKDATLIVAKGRNVRTGKLSLEYVGPRYEFLPAMQSEYAGDFP